MTNVPPKNQLVNQLGKVFCRRKEDISQWIAQQSQGKTLPFYSSIDLRSSGYKMAPVDCNLFPAGFNNICERDQKKLPGNFSGLLESEFPGLKKILLVPEEITQNSFYVENLAYLDRILRQAGFDVHIGWYGQLVPETPSELISNSGIILQPEALIRKGDFLETTSGFRPDIILINNDFSSGFPDRLSNLKQPVVPPLHLGWHTRKKHQHFEIYNRLATEFAKFLEIDPWTFTIETRVVEPVDFMENQGLEGLAQTVQQVLDQMEKEYLSRGIKDTPQVFVKSNLGTYGMGILTAQKGEDLLNLNRRERNKMNYGKSGAKVTSVIVQEAIPTEFSLEGSPAEPVIYFVGTHWVGGFLRTNPQRGTNDNLNSRGMVFQKLCLAELDRAFQEGLDPLLPPCNCLLELVFGTISQLSVIAASRE